MKATHGQKDLPYQNSVLKTLFPQKENFSNIKFFSSNKVFKETGVRSAHEIYIHDMELVNFKSTNLKWPKDLNRLSARGHPQSHSQCPHCKVSLLPVTWEDELKPARRATVQGEVTCRKWWAAKLLMGLKPLCKIAWQNCNCRVLEKSVPRYLLENKNITSLEELTSAPGRTFKTVKKRNN